MPIRPDLSAIDGRAFLIGIAVTCHTFHYCCLTKFRDKYVSIFKTGVYAWFNALLHLY